MQLSRGADYGCESYEVSEDIEAPHTFVLVARSRDLDAHYEHFRNLKFAELTTSLGEVLTGQPQVTIKEVASTPTLNRRLGGRQSAGKSRGSVCVGDAKRKASQQRDRRARWPPRSSSKHDGHPLRRPRTRTEQLTTRDHQA